MFTKTGVIRFAFKRWARRGKRVRRVSRRSQRRRHRWLSNPTVWHPCAPSSATWPPPLVLLKTIKKTFPLFTRASKSDGGLPAQPTTAVVPCVGCNFSNSIGLPTRLPKAPPRPPTHGNGHWTPPPDLTPTTTTTSTIQMMPVPASP